MKTKLIFLLGIILLISLVIPLTSASVHTLSNETIIRSIILGSELNISSFDVGLDKLIIETDSIAFTGLKYKNPVADHPFQFNRTFNWTTSRLNLTDSSLPYVIDSRLYYGMNQTTDVQDVNFTVKHCSMNGIVYSSAHGNYNKAWGTAENAYFCEVIDEFSALLTVKNITIENGTNNISIDYRDVTIGIGGGPGIAPTVRYLNDTRIVMENKWYLDDDFFFYLHLYIYDNEGELYDPLNISISTEPYSFEKIAFEKIEKGAYYQSFRLDPDTKPEEYRVYIIAEDKWNIVIKEKEFEVIKRNFYDSIKHFFSNIGDKERRGGFFSSILSSLENIMSQDSVKEMFSQFKQDLKEKGTGFIIILLVIIFSVLFIIVSIIVIMTTKIIEGIGKRRKQGNG